LGERINYSESKEQELRAYVNKARELGKMLYCPYYSITISPDDLEKAWERGQYRWWNLSNWRMIDKKDSPINGEDIEKMKKILDNTAIDYPLNFNYVEMLQYLSDSYAQIVIHYEDIIGEKENEIEDLRKKIKGLENSIYGKTKSN